MLIFKALLTKRMVISVSIKEEAESSIGELIRSSEPCLARREELVCLSCLFDGLLHLFAFFTGNFSNINSFSTTSDSDIE